MNPAKIVAWSTLFLLPVAAAIILIVAIRGGMDSPFGRQASGAAALAQTESSATSATATITDLAIGISVFPPGQINPGQTIGYNIIITNAGGTVINNAVLTDILSPHILNRRVYSSGTTIDNSGLQPEFVWSIGSLGPGARAYIDVTGMIDPALSTDVTITNTVAISASGDQQSANNQNQSVLVIDVPSIGFDSSTIQVDEADSSISIDVVLSHENRNAPITVDYTTLNSASPPNASASDFVPASGTLTFNPGHRRESLSIQLTDDDIAEASESFAVVLRTPVGAHIDAAGSVTVFIEDDDEAGVRISSSRAFLSETGTTDSYNVRLKSQPESNVEVFIVTDEQTQPDVDSLIFTDANWASPQTVTILAVDDDVAEGEHMALIEHVVKSDDSAYNNLIPMSITAEIIDNDVTGVSFSTRSLTVAEDGENATYELQLLGQPTATVTIDFVTNAQTKATPPQLVFSVTNWDTPQTVQIDAVDDADIEGEHTVIIEHAVSSEDLAYNQSTIGNVNVKILDNDFAGLTISKEIIELSEGSPSNSSAQSYTVRLTSKPTDVVTASISTHETLEITPQSIRFSPSNWSLEQSVTVQAIDDQIAMGMQTITVTHNISSNDSNYIALTDKLLAVMVEDNDTPGVSVGIARPVQVGESGTTGSYSIFVNSQPAEPLHISFVTDSQIRVEPPSVTINESNWRTSRILTVSAIDDDLDEGIHSSTIQHTASSNDPAYDGFEIASVQVKISDNDSTGEYAIDGTVYEDTNKNNEWDDDEEALRDVGITIVDSATGGQAFSNETKSDEQGNYRFSDVSAGDYTIAFFPPIGFRQNSVDELSIVVDGEDVLIPPYAINRKTDNIYLPLAFR